MVQYCPNDTFAALGDPSRRRMVELLSGGERSGSELAAALPMTLTGALKHLAVLDRCGVVSRRKHGRRVIFRLEPDSLADAERWLLETRMFWTHQLARLSVHLEEDS